MVSPRRSKTTTKRAPARKGAAAKGKDSTQPQQQQDDDDDDDDNHQCQDATPKAAAAAASTCTKRKRKERMMREFDTLHKEMEVATYARTHNGQNRRTVPKAQSKSRTRKRRLLEQEDKELMAVYGDEEEDETNAANDKEHSTAPAEKKKKRLRGSRASLDDAVVEASAIFTTTKHKKKATTDEEGEEDDYDPDEEGDQDDDEEDEEFVADGDEEEVEEEEEEEEEDALVADDDDDDDDDDDNNNNNNDGKDVPTPKPKTGKGSGKKRGKYNVKHKKPVKRPPHKRRTFFKMKNFQSQKMARRHGDALGAHARGQPQLAIAKLKAVARDAPSAPQVYSSLGMVYEEMLRASIRKHTQNSAEPQPESQPAESPPKEAAADAKPPSDKDAEDDADMKVIAADEEEDDDKEQAYKLLLPHLREQISLAKKAYGSYHVAAILCKKDFQLWVRAADAANQIAELHGLAMVQAATTTDNISTLSRLDIQGWHRSEKRRWWNEAKHDFTMADNLKPPGIDVPAKLAMIHMELGNLADALTLLTDLKNKHAETGTLHEIGHKAWQLYADLMLRIGHECIQWNNGVQTNDNHMFRRWLRKWSGTFDWRERRLQALSLALEAAAGTQSCARYLDWVRRRTLQQQQQQQQQEQMDKDGEGDGNLTVTIAEPEAQQPTSESSEMDTQEKVDSPSSQAKQYAVEKQLMLERNERELAAFDQSTKDMDLAGNKQATNERTAARKNLVETHQSAVVSLAGEFHAKEQTDDPGNAPEPNKEESPGDESEVAAKDPPKDIKDELTFEHNNMALAASCRTVCSIASELMKNLLNLELFDGGRLVGESVSLYLRERARVYDKRAEARRKVIEISNKPKPLFALQGNNYDEINDDTDLSDAEGDDVPYLSDDEQLDAADDSEVLNSLRRGALPPETSVLFALCLLQEGGRNFVAKKCFESIDLLEQETRDWLLASVVDSSLSNNSQWHIFRISSTEPLGRMAAYALIAETLQKRGKESEWANHFAPSFDRQMKVMEDEGLINELLSADTAFSPVSIYRRNLLVKVVLAWCRLQFGSASEKFTRLSQESLTDGNANDESKVALEAMFGAIQALKKYLNISGSRSVFTQHNGSISPLCAEIISSLGKGFSKLTTEYEKLLDKSSLPKLLDECEELVFWLSGAVDSESDSGREDRVLMPDDWKQEVLPSAWQSAKDKAISLRCYNLCIGVNATSFSGWNKDEFSLNSMKKTGPSSYFGLKMDDDRVTGILPSAVEDELVKQWEILSESFPNAWSFDFKGRLNDTKGRSWYQDTKDQRLRMLERESIANNGEVGGLELFLSFSKACLMKAKSPNLKSMEGLELLSSALSVLLPLTQFCVDQKVWDSDIGKAATRAGDANGWLQLTKKRSAAPKPAPKPLKPAQPSIRKRIAKPAPKPIDERFRGEKKVNHLANAVPIPASELNRLWSAARGPSSQSIYGPTDEAQEAMQKVHEAVITMRACFSEEAIEKACIQVAVAMLDLVSEDCCENPFVCLQQAAIFASHGTKRGTSDALFREGLPKASECTPEDALVILGRADCFQAVFFPYEAAFLCSYVAGVCKMHRQGVARHAEALPCVWNDQWKIVGILCYNVSTMIRTTVGQVLLSETQKEEFNPWDSDVVEELMRGRADAIAWKSTLTGLEWPSAQDLVTVDPTTDPKTAKDKDDNDDVDDAEDHEASSDGDHSVPVEVVDTYEPLPGLEDFGATVGHNVSEDLHTFNDVDQVAV